MSRQANPAAIGLFVIGAFAIALGGIVFLGSNQLFTSRDEFILYFEDSIHGLDEGGQVKFKGVPVGEVKQILIHFNQPEDSVHIPVLIEVDRKKILETLGNASGSWDQGLFERQVKNGLRGRLELQSIITGVLIVTLDYFEDVDAPVFIQEKPVYREIPTRASAFTDLGRDLSQTLDSLSHIDFQGIFSDVQLLLENANSKLDAMRLEELSASIQGMAGAIEQRMNSELLTQVLDQGRTFLKSGTQTFESIGDQVAPLGQAFSDTAKRFEATLDQLDRTLADYSSLVAPHSADHVPVQSMLDDMGAAARALRELTQYLELNPNALLTGRGPVQRP